MVVEVEEFHTGHGEIVIGRNSCNGNTAFEFMGIAHPEVDFIGGKSIIGEGVCAPRTQLETAAGNRQRRLNRRRVAEFQPAPDIPAVQVKRSVDGNPILGGSRNCQTYHQNQYETNSTYIFSFYNNWKLLFYLSAHVSTFAMERLIEGRVLGLGCFDRDELIDNPEHHPCSAVYDRISV